MLMANHRTMKEFWGGGNRWTLGGGDVKVIRSGEEKMGKFMVRKDESEWDIWRA